MKKIGILTFHRAHNYGASLQCLALKKFIEKYDENSKVKIINYANKKIDYDYSLFRIDYTSLYTIIKSFLSSIIFMKSGSSILHKASAPKKLPAPQMPRLLCCYLFLSPFLSGVPFLNYHAAAPTLSPLSHGIILESPLQLRHPRGYIWYCTYIQDFVSA